MIEITMPRLSDTMTEGAISTWRKQPGDTVTVGDPLVEIETDKAVMEYEAYQAGTLAQILVPEGQTADIGAPIALIDDGSADTAQTPSPERTKAAAPAPASSPAPAPAGGPDDANGAAPAAADTQPGPQSARPAASPLVRKLARENHLDLSGVTGSGPGGRIIRADIAPLLAEGPASGPDDANGAAPATANAQSSPQAPAAGAGPAAPAAPAAAAGAGDDVRGSRSVPLSQVRRVIARRLSASARDIPHYYVTAAADAEELMTLRAQLNDKLTAAGRAKISVNDLLIRAAALALREHPDVNASWGGDDSDSMLVHDRVNIGVAVAARSGLIVPVITDADTKTVTQLSAEARELVKLATERKLTPAQTSGGTFTISNLGMYGVEEFTAIINPPESAILAVGGTAKEPAVVDGEIVPRYKMRYTLSSDHRVIDGALAAKFLQTLTSLIESPWMIVA
jgi:pyruvate dehydrogenase E2 component (dihydrolipoamide acetyltransferase)